MTPRAMVSIVIPTRNRPAQLATCLRAVGTLEYPSDRFEVVVVDDGGTESLDEAVRSVDGLSVRLHRVRHGGPGAARNAGAGIANGDVLAFVDDDCLPDRRWLSALVSRLERRPDALVGGRTENALVGNPFATASQLLVSYLYEYFADPARQRRRFFTTNNLAVRRDAFEEVGGFNPRTPCGTAEDRDFCARWAHAGRPLEYEPDAIVMHAHNLSARTFWRQHSRYGRSALYVERARAARAGEQIRLEPLTFYARMLAYPFSRVPLWRAPAMSLLIGVTQLAYAQGVLTQLLLDTLNPSSDAENNRKTG